MTGKRPRGRTNHRKDGEMSKLKTKSGAKKRFKVTGGGKVRVKYAYKAHNLRKRPQQMKRQNRGMKTLTRGEGNTVRKHFLPYS
jgi:large subunit ribosomal protein L35